MSNLITDRVAYFLKDYPPFSEMEQSDLDQIADKITVKYFRPDEYLFKEGDEQSGFCFVLNQGNIKLFKNESLKEVLVDQCEPGDIFGVRSIITKSHYSMTAQSVEESLVYAIPKELFERLFRNNPSFSSYFASGYAAGQVIVRSDHATQSPMKASVIAPKMEYTKEVITCHEASIAEAASIMSQHGVGSIIITNQKNCPLGIVTDTDLRNKVLAKGKDPNDSVKSIMSSPVKAIKESVTLSEVMMEMIRTGVHHLVVTADGTHETAVRGIISDHDVVMSQQNHPASLLKSIKRSTNPSEWSVIRDKAEVMLQEFLDQEVKTSLIATLITKINDTIIEKAIALALEKYPEAASVNFCWLSLGSEGREEQLLRTDQDNAILFEDSQDNEQTQKLLLNVAVEVNAILVQCGFVECPAQIMAKNPKYCQPISEWKAYFDSWIQTPDPKAVMNSTIFFDYRSGFGGPDLIDQLDKYLIQAVRKNPIFLNFLAQNSLQNPPPLSFFKNFLVERGGEHKDEFDIKKRAMMPLADTARLLLLDHHVSGIQNTVERYHKLAELEPNNRELYEAAAESYEIFMAHRASNGLKNGDSGRFIDLNDLNKLEKQVLKNAFLSIKELQDITKVRFQQSFFS